MKSHRMNLTALALMLLALALPALGQKTAAKSAVATSPSQIKTPPLRQVNMPQPTRVQLDNGMVIFLMEDHELPLIRGSANIRGGGRDIPAEKSGLPEIYGQAWRTGGTQSKSGDELDDFLDARAARVETNADDDSSAISMDVLKDDFDTVFPIFLDLLKNPAFRQEKIDLARTQMNTGISRRNDEPGEILSRELRRLGYGTTSPYAAQPEYSTVASITRDDLVAFHNRFTSPNNIIFGIGGDFDTATMERKLRDAFASWQRGPQAPPPPAAASAIKPAKPGVYFVTKSDVTQANIGFVAPGIQRNNPDYYALQVMNEILSGGFSGRLMNHLRSQRGLTYGVGGGVGSNWDYPGLFRMQMSTKSGTTIESIQALQQEMTDLRTKPFTVEEMKLAKESLLNQFVFTRDSRAKVLNQAVMLEFYGFPLDYYSKYPTNIEKVMATDVERVAKQYITPDKVAVLVVGNDKDFEKPLTTIGAVTPIDITIPEPGAKPGAPAASAAPAASNPEGVALANKVRDYFGGQAAINAVKAVRTVTALKTTTPQGPMDIEVDSLRVQPDRIHSVMKTPMGEITTVSTPEAAFMVLPGMGVRDLPASQREASRADDRTDPLHVFAAQDQYTFAVSGDEKVGNVNAKVLTVTPSGGEPIRWVVDPATGRILRKISRSRNPGMPGEQVVEFTEWKKFGGVNFPTGFTITTGGQPSGSAQVKTVEVNPTVDPKLFEKPAQ